MNVLELNFSDSKQRQKQRSSLFVAALLVIIFIMVLWEHEAINNEVNDVENTIASLQGFTSVQQVKPTELDLRKTKMMRDIQQHLNLPWYELLTAIETVKLQTNEINLLTVQPNPTKKEVLISAEASNLQAMLAFVSLLEQQATFHDVFLVNQRPADALTRRGLAFTVKMGWQN